jgi:large subunit ribosomal protein L3
MTMLLGKKIGMTQVYDDDGQMLPVTVIQAGPCTVTQVKSIKSDGYNGLQLGFDDVKPSRRKKTQIGHCKKSNTTVKKFVREMRLSDDVEPEYKTGDILDVTVFEEAGKVDVTGTSKGKGYAGGMKRHGFSGFPKSHGTKGGMRQTGSIAASASGAGRGGGPKKGKRMPGQLGNDRVTNKGLDLVRIDQEKNLVIVKGSVPGANGGYVIVKSSDKS